MSAVKGAGFTLLSVVLVGLLIAGGYFAIAGMTSPERYLPAEKETVGDLRPITTDANTGMDADTGVAETPSAVPNTTSTTATLAGTAGSATTTASTDLKTNIETLIANKTTLKIGAKGPSVGYVQQFMNLYFQKTLKVDNDFGKILQANVIAFQKAVKLPQTGTVANQTLTAMVSWLADHPRGQ